MLAAALVALHAATMAISSANVPRGDDAISVLPFLAAWSDTSDWGGRVALLRAQHFSHRIALTRIAALTERMRPGSFDLRVLQAGGWLAWLATVVLVVRAFPTARSDPAAWLVAAGLLFTPLGHTNFLSAMQAVQNLGVILLAAAAVHLAARAGTIAAAAALSLAAIATHTSANGLLLPITLAVVWAALGRWRAAALAGVAALLLTGIYFHGYVWPAGDFAFSRVPANAAVMLGAFASNSWTGTTLVVLVGGAMFVAGGVVALRPSWWRSRPAAGGILVFLLLSVLLAAKGRSDVGSEYMMQDRYHLYGLLTAAVLLGFTHEALPTGWRRAAGAAAAVGAVGFAVHAYSSVLPRLATESRWVAASAINRQLGGDFLLASGPVWEDFRRGLAAAERAGAFAMPPLIGPEGLRQIDSLALAPVRDADFTVGPSAANLGAELRAPTAAGFEPAPFVLAVHEGNRLVLPLDRRRVSWRRFATTGRVWDERFSYVWPSETYRAGIHALHGFELTPGGGVRILWSARVDCPPL